MESAAVASDDIVFRPTDRLSVVPIGEANHIAEERRVTPPVSLHLPAGEVARAGMVLLALVVGSYLLWRLTEVVLLAFLAVLLATAIEPLVNRLRRGPFSKGTGALAVYLAIVLVVGLPVYIAAPTVAVQGTAFAEELPGRLATLRSEVEPLQPPALRDALLGALDRASLAARSPGTPGDAELVLVGTTAARLLFDLVTVFFLGFYWLIERNAVKRVVLQLAGPHRAREVSEAWLEVEQKWGGWVRGQLTLMLTIGVVAGLGYVMLGLPSPVLLATFAAVAEMVPMVGPFLAFLPAVLIAFTISPGTALAVLAFALVFQQIEGNVLVPRVMSHAAAISPLTVMLGILVGLTLYGLPGAFLAVPVAAALQVIVAATMRSRSHERSVLAASAATDVATP
ncbi:MAG: AI-2E family transporter [Chloroflexota bacterium]|nr:MAG: AI-2E family transporter [Chloroflexota bacterium]